MTDKLLALSLPKYGELKLPSQIANIVNAQTTYGGNILGWGMNLIFVLATIASLAYMIYGGWKWITSSGDAKNLETAHNTVIYAAVGLGIIFLSAFFVNVAAAFFCIPLLGWIPASCQ